MLWSCCQVITSASRGKVWSEASVTQFSWIITDRSCPRADVTRVWGIMCIHYFCCKCVIYRYEDKLMGVYVCIFSTAFSSGVICVDEMWDPQQSLFSRSLKTNMFGSFWQHKAGLFWPSWFRINIWPNNLNPSYCLKMTILLKINYYTPKMSWERMTRVTTQTTVIINR